MHQVMCGSVIAGVRAFELWWHGCLLLYRRDRESGDHPKLRPLTRQCTYAHPHTCMQAPPSHTATTAASRLRQLAVSQLW